MCARRGAARSRSAPVVRIGPRQHDGAQRTPCRADPVRASCQVGCCNRSRARRATRRATPRFDADGATSTLLRSRATASFSCGSKSMAEECRAAPGRPVATSDRGRSRLARSRTVVRPQPKPNGNRARCCPMNADAGTAPPRSRFDDAHGAGDAPPHPGDQPAAVIRKPKRGKCTTTAPTAGSLRRIADLVGRRPPRASPATGSKA